MEGIVLKLNNTVEQLTSSNNSLDKYKFQNSQLENEISNLTRNSSSSKTTITRCNVCYHCPYLSLYVLISLIYLYMILSIIIITINISNIC